MAPTFQHGKGAAVLVNKTNMSVILNDASFDATADVAEVTNFGSSGNREYIAGVRDASGSFSGMFDGSTNETDQVFEALLGNSTAAVITYGPGGDTIGTPAYLGAARVTSYNVASPASDVVAASMAVQYTSESRSGFWLADLGARSTATTHATVVMPGSSASTLGGIGHLHVISATTNVGGAELNMKIQDSSAGSVWADVLTFASVSSTAPESYQRVLVTGEVLDQVKATASLMSSTNATYSVAFARR